MRLRPSIKAFDPIASVAVSSGSVRAADVVLSSKIDTEGALLEKVFWQVTLKEAC